GPPAPFVSGWGRPFLHYLHTPDGGTPQPGDGDQECDGQARRGKQVLGDSDGTGVWRDRLVDQRAVPRWPGYEAREYPVHRLSLGKSVSVTSPRALDQSRPLRRV